MKAEARDLVVVRGGGDLATGVAQKLFRVGIRLLILETERPLAIRRTVSLAEAVYDGAAQVEDMTARRVRDVAHCPELWRQGEIPLLVDPDCACLSRLKPNGVVDAILAKRNLGTSPAMAEIVIALGPGFTAPRDAHAIVETQRGHNLGRVIFEGAALPNTGTPGVISGKGAERVMRAPCAGTVRHHKQIGDIVRRGEAVFSVNGTPAPAPFTGLLRGLIREGLEVEEGLKTADVDPRPDSDWNSISDKARCVGGGVLEAYLYLRNKKLYSKGRERLE